MFHVITSLQRRQVTYLRSLLDYYAVKTSYARTVRASAGSFSYGRRRGKLPLPLDHHLWTATVQSASGYGSRRHVRVAFGAAAPLGLGFLHVVVLATQMHVSDSDQRPVRLV